MREAGETGEDEGFAGLRICLCIYWSSFWYVRGTGKLLRSTAGGLRRPQKLSGACLAIGVTLFPPRVIPPRNTFVETHSWESENQKGSACIRLLGWPVLLSVKDTCVRLGMCEFIEIIVSKNHRVYV